MSRQKARTPYTRKVKDRASVPTKNTLRRGPKPVHNPLSKIKSNLTCQVNSDFLAKFEAIVEDSGFESTSEAMREALRRFIRTEARANRMMKRYVEERDGVSLK